MQSKLRIIVGGLAGLHPVGGMAWHYLQYVIGLHRLGHDVYYHEDTWSWPYHPIEKQHTRDGSYSARYIRAFLQRYAPDLSDRWHYLHLHDESFGMSRESFDDVAETADLFLNVSGACFLPEKLAPRCVTVFLDTDPGYNQIVLSERFSWSDNVERWCAAVAEHDRHFTFAQNMNAPDCLVPKVGLKWRTTRMPVLTDLWKPVSETSKAATPPWTTIMTWNAFKGRLLYQGVEYGSKGAEFEKLIDLPKRTHVPLKIAVGGIKAPLERLEACGWQVVDAPAATETPERYQRFIESSRGELSTAKHVYVAMRTGWFSERTTCYLAAGRPAVVQDTVFSAILPSGEGLIAFSTATEALAALEKVDADYARHARAARDLADTYFDSRKVLSEFVEAALESPARDAPR